MRLSRRRYYVVDSLYEASSRANLTWRLSLERTKGTRLIVLFKGRLTKLDHSSTLKMMLLHS